MTGILIAVVATAAVVGITAWSQQRRTNRQVRDKVTAIANALEGPPDDGSLAVPSASTVGEALDHLERVVHDVVDARTLDFVASRRLIGALDALPQGVVVIDSDEQVVFHNEAGAQYSAARHGDALVEAAMREMLSRAIRGERSVDTIELYGPPRQFLVITAAPLDPDDGLTGAVAVIDDVTERRRLEAVRRDFVSNISHELKTPVGALALLAETLTDEPDHEVASRLAHRIYKEAHRVARTIDDLLELSRIEAEESPHRETIAVADLLQDAVERMRPAAEQKNITLELHPPSPRVTVAADGRQLVSAVFNLLENAVKYSEPGSLVEVGASTDGRSVDLSVRDHGMGIPARDLDRVFERFYRVDQARSRQTGGTGLGLAIVRHVVNNHGGQVLVDSVEGTGSTFTLRLPSGAGPVLLSVDEVS